VKSFQKNARLVKRIPKTPVAQGVMRRASAADLFPEGYQALKSITL
jgi:hypothetical protein